MLQRSFAEAAWCRMAVERVPLPAPEVVTLPFKANAERRHHIPKQHLVSCPANTN